MFLVHGSSMLSGTLPFVKGNAALKPQDKTANVTITVFLAHNDRMLYQLVRNTVILQYFDAAGCVTDGPLRRFPF